MKELRAWEWGDPEKVAIRREESSCKGCIHEQKREDIFSTGPVVIVGVCAVRQQYGTRCGRYGARKQ